MRRATCVFAALLIAACHLPADDDLAARLGSPDRRAALQAIEDAVNRGPEAIPELRAILNGDDRLAIQYAAVALGRINAPGADYALLTSLSPRGRLGDAYLIQFASEALAARGDDALPVLRRALALDRPVRLLDELRPTHRSAVRGHQLDLCIGALPRDVMNELLQELVARSMRYSYATAFLLLEQGEPGMRLWAESYLRDEPLPTLEEANDAWRQPLAGRSARQHYEVRRTLKLGAIGFDGGEPYELWSVLDRFPAGDLFDVALEYARSSAPGQRLWAFSQLLAIVPSDVSSETMSRAELERAILTDPHWRIPLLLNWDMPFEFRGGEPEEFRGALRTCMENDGEAAAVLAAATLLQISDEQAVKFAIERLPGACPRTAQVLAQAFARARGLSDEDRASLAEPLIERAHREREKWLVNVLSRMGFDPPLVEEPVVDPDERRRLAIVRMPVDLSREEAVPQLEAALDDPSPEVRTAALASLARRLRSGVETYLEPFMASDDAADRRAAFHAAYVTSDAELMARVFRRIPEDCEMSGHGSLTSPSWGPNDADRHGRTGSEAEPDTPRNPSPPVLQEAAWEVLQDESRSGEARWNAASLIAWDAFERRGGTRMLRLPSGAWRDEGPDRTAADVALINEDLWPVVEALMRHHEFYDRAPRRTQSEEFLHVEWAVRHARRGEAVPLLAAWATEGVDDLRRPVHSLPLVTLAQIEPEGVQWLLRQVPDASSALAREAARALAQAGVEEAIAPITERSHAEPRDRRQWLDVLRSFEGEAARNAIRGIVLSLPLEDLTGDDLQALIRADVEAAQGLAPTVIARSRDHELRRVAVSAFARRATPDARGLLLQVTRDELELYQTRYRALRVLEEFDPELARDIAEQWTHDHRFTIRRFGRDVLRGPEVRHH